MVMNIRVLTPDRVICSTTADEVVLPGLTGQVGVLPEIAVREAKATSAIIRGVPWACFMLKVASL